MFVNYHCCCYLEECLLAWKGSWWIQHWWLSTLKKTELISLTTHYKLKVVSSAKKADSWRALKQYFVDKEIVSEDEESLPDPELRKLELQERKGRGKSTSHQRIRTQRVWLVHPIKDKGVRSGKSCYKLCFCW